MEQPKRKIGRNDPCTCGSGKKYKKCCLAQVDEARAKARAAEAARALEHVHGPDCDHEAEGEAEVTPEHVHGPGCDHAHGEPVAEQG